MAFPFGQNATELGRNIIDLEQLKNARDAQQAQAQNQFLAQLNQARLGQQQIAAQSQAQQNALMMQALQQRQQQGNLDRDFGLRQTAQGNQAQQFRDALELDRKRLEVNPYNPSTVTAMARENFLRERQNKLAQGKAAEAASLLNAELQRYDAKKKLTIKDTPSFFKPGFIDQKNIAKQLDADAKEHKDKISAIIAGLSEFRDMVNITEDQLDPGKVRFEPILLPPIDMSGFGRGAGNFPIPVDRPVETGVGPLPLTPTRIQPGRSSTPTPFSIAQQVAQQSRYGNHTVSGLPFGVGLGLNPSSGIRGAINAIPAIPAPSIQKPFSEIDSAAVIPLINQSGEVRFPLKEDAKYWFQFGWKLHPEAMGQIQGGSNFSPAMPASGQNNWDILPIPAY